MTHSYGDKIPVISKKSLYKNEKIPVQETKEYRFSVLLRKTFDPLHKLFLETQSQIESLKKEVIHVRVDNNVEFPEVQKIEVTNWPKEKEVIEVKVNNFPEDKDLQQVKVINWPKEKEVVFPEVQDVQIKNYPKTQNVKLDDLSSLLKALEKLLLPTGEGQKAGKANPSKYVNVRLTDGDRFYKALDEFYVATQKSGGSSKLQGFVTTGQAKITTGGQAIQLENHPLTNGVIVSASSDNSGPVTVGMSNVSSTTDGTGNGYILEAGSSVSFAVTNTNVIYINGATGDVVSYAAS